jgi:hypothetical protein
MARVEAGTGAGAEGRDMPPERERTGAWAAAVAASSNAVTAVALRSFIIWRRRGVSTRPFGQTASLCVTTEFPAWVDVSGCRRVSTRLRATLGAAREDEKDD